MYGVPRPPGRADSSARSATPEAGSHLRLIDSCITQLKAQGPSRTCNESKEEEEEEGLGCMVYRGLLGVQTVPRLPPRPRARLLEAFRFSEAGPPNHLDDKADSDQ